MQMSSMQLLRALMVVPGFQTPEEILAEVGEGLLVAISNRALSAIAVRYAVYGLRVCADVPANAAR